MRDRNAGPAGRHTTGPSLQTGAAGMGGQMMPAEETWGEGMINEEERGSARDF
jgi:hypothetical protein